MKQIINLINLLKGFKRLKVKGTAGNYAVIVDQTDNFVGLVEAQKVKNLKEVWGKKTSETIDVKLVSHGSYHHDLTVKPLLLKEGHTWWGTTATGEIAIVEYFDVETHGLGIQIASNFKGRTPVNLVELR